MVALRPTPDGPSRHSSAALTRPTPKQRTRHLVNNASPHLSTSQLQPSRPRRPKTNNRACPLGRQPEAVRLAIATAYLFSTFDRSSGSVLEPVSVVLSEKEYAHFISFVACSVLDSTRLFTCNYDTTNGELYIEMPTPTHEANTSLCKHKINEGIMRQFDRLRERLKNMTDDEFETLKSYLMATSNNGTADVQLLSRMEQGHKKRMKELLGQKYADGNPCEGEHTIPLRHFLYIKDLNGKMQKIPDLVCPPASLLDSIITIPFKNYHDQLRLRVGKIHHRHSDDSGSSEAVEGIMPAIDMATDVDDSHSPNEQDSPHQHDSQPPNEQDSSHQQPVPITPPRQIPFDDEDEIICPGTPGGPTRREVMARSRLIRREVLGEDRKVLAEEERLEAFHTFSDEEAPPLDEGQTAAHQSAIVAVPEPAVSANEQEELASVNASVYPEKYTDIDMDDHEDYADDEDYGEEDEESTDSDSVVTDISDDGTNNETNCMVVGADIAGDLFESIGDDDPDVVSPDFDRAEDTRRGEDELKEWKKHHCVG
ncbi:hypothetical protein BJ508DRAFT_312666 [Ascobolus immersus RN42]|uniref:Uncharacterized protein n=1 Tax=Ascobolus immersus RN42 TaxID=1160509 RepID=A0A3N4HLJ4_ASCIM|nr:hypothetical protein BJ508DRAFT_312666 [Ascobolus immersus RN42]